MTVKDVEFNVPERLQISFLIFFFFRKKTHYVYFILLLQGSYYVFETKFKGNSRTFKGKTVKIKGQ